MSASLKIILHSKKYPDGTQHVMLQCFVHADGKKVWKRKNLFRVLPNQFDKPTGRIRKHPSQTLLNAQIAQAYQEAESRMLQMELAGQPVDADVVLNAPPEVATDRSALQRAGIIQHGLAYVKRCRQKGQIHTAEKYEGHITRLSQYLGNKKGEYGKDVPMDEVTEDWILKWSVWLRSHGTKSDNTLHRRMAFITTLFNDARRRKLTSADPMAFLEFKMQRVRKPKLTLDQIGRLETVELSDRLNDARNTFLLQFYAYGSRISDALTWKKTDLRRDGDALYLSYTSMKTGDLIDVRLNKRAEVMVGYYVQTVPGPFLLPWLSGYVNLPNLTDGENKQRLIKQIESKTEMVNLNLKAVAKTAGIDINLTTHIARHSFANLADSRVLDKRKISAALGHSKFSTTEVYLSELRQSDVNDAMDEVWK